MRITQDLDVLSLWCWHSDQALRRVLEEFGDRVTYDWKISLVGLGEPLGASADDEPWFYRRATHITGVALRCDWVEGRETSTVASNVAVEAARVLGISDSRAYRALMEAGMVRGEPVTRPDVAARVVAGATGLDQVSLERVIADPATLERVQASTAEMLSFGVDQRPAIVLESAIPDRAILSGVWAYEALSALTAAMLRDEERYLAFNAANPR